MKQLLQVVEVVVAGEGEGCNNEQRYVYAIAALNDRAFVGRLSSSATDDKASSSSLGLLFELSGGSSSNENNNETTENGDGGGDNDNRAVYGPDVNPREIQSVAIFSSYDDDNKKEKTERSNPPTTKKPVLFCAVSRYDKTLSVYRIPIQTKVQDDTKQQKAAIETATITPDVELIPPTVTHKLHKRAGSLWLTTVSSAVSKDVHSDNGNNDPDGQQQQPQVEVVILAGDLAGDATAYACREERGTKNELSKTTTTSDKEQSTTAANDDPNEGNLKQQSIEKKDGKNEDDVDIDKKTSTKRLLLGHTASMLTGIAVVPAGDETASTSSYLLTCDRDEKIRISCFPRTWAIEGYLLGHTSFISSMAVPSTTATPPPPPICATCAGDGTLRIWNYVAQLQVGQIEIGKRKRFSNSAADQTVDAAAAEEQEPENDETDSDDNLIPARIAMSPSGCLAAVSYNESTQVDVFHIIQCNNSSNTNQMGDEDDACTTQIFKSSCSFSLECESAALSVALPNESTLVVLQTEPTYLQTYSIKTEKTAGTDDQMETEESLPVTPTAITVTLDDTETICEALRHLATTTTTTATIKMPESVMERDPKKGSLKLSRSKETRGPAHEMPWNNVERKVVAQARNRRSVAKRQLQKREERKQKQQEEQNAKDSPADPENNNNKKQKTTTSSSKNEDETATKTEENKSENIQ